MLFKISTPRVVAFFKNKTCIFFFIFLTFMFSIQVFQPMKKFPLGFVMSYWKMFFGHGFVFNIYYHKSLQFFFAFCYFFEYFVPFRFLQPQEPHNLL